MALITLARAQMIPSLSGAAPAYLTLLLDAASNLVERYCKRKFESATYTDEVYDGEGTKLLQLDRFPIISLTNMKVVESDETEETALGAQFRIDYDIGEIKFKPDATSTYTYFPKGWQNIKVTYVAGFAAVPEDVQEATAQVCAWLHAIASATPGVKGWKLGDAAVTYVSPNGDAPLLPAVVLALLATWRQVIP